MLLNDCWVQWLIGTRFLWVVETARRFVIEGEKVDCKMTIFRLMSSPDVVHTSLRLWHAIFDNITTTFKEKCYLTYQQQVYTDLVEIQVRWETQYVHRTQTKLGMRSPSSNATKQKHITYMNVLLNTAIIGIICANAFVTVYTGSNIRPNKQFYQSNIISFPLKSAVYSYRNKNKSIKPTTLFASLLLSVISQMFDGFFP